MSAASPRAHSPVRLRASSGPGQPDVTPGSRGALPGFEQQLLVPLRTEIGDLMPVHPRSHAVPHLWRWNDLQALAGWAGDLVPVEMGRDRWIERRATS